MKGGRKVDQASYNFTAACGRQGSQSLLMDERTFGNQTFHSRLSNGVMGASTFGGGTGNALPPNRPTWVSGGRSSWSESFRARLQSRNVESNLSGSSSGFHCESNRRT